MKLLPLTAGAVAGANTVTLTGQVGDAGTIGGVLITTDGTNAADVVLRKNDGAGAILFDISTKTPIFVVAPIKVDDTATVHYTISGTGAAAMLYEWHD